MPRENLSAAGLKLTWLPLRSLTLVGWPPRLKWMTWFVVHDVSVYSRVVAFATRANVICRPGGDVNAPAVPVGLNCHAVPTASV